MAAAALIALTLLRLVVAALVPLSPDEAYYWVWSRALAAGYPDHPPMVALWIRVGTLIAGDDALGIRLLGPLSVGIASIALFDAGECLLPGCRAGLRAAALLNATLLFGVGAVIMTPDTPLLFFWTCCLWASARLVCDGSAAWWLVIGFFAGLAMISKYTAAFLWLGIPLWLLITPAPRPWLRRPAPWLGALLGIALFLPVVLWNAHYGWASFVRQGGRLEVWRPLDAARFLAELLLGQAGLVTPLVFAFCAGGMVVATRQSWRTGNPRWTLLASLTLPAVVVFVQHAFGDRVQGNWPAIIYPAAGIASAALQRPVWQRLERPALAIGVAMTLLAYAQAAFTLLPLPVRLDPTALRLSGWVGLADQVEKTRRREGASFVAADQYGLVSEFARLLPPDVPVIAIEPRWRLFNLPRFNPDGEVGLMVLNGRGGEATTIGEAQRRRGPDLIQSYRLQTISRPPLAVLLPRP